ncbi:MAG: hypothetical protein ACRDF7_04010 [Candidatus Limnocylindrales bacterium]
MNTAGANVTTCLAAIGRGSWAIALYSAIFATGLGAAVAISVGQTLQTALAARRQPASEVVPEPSA